MLGLVFIALSMLCGSMFCEFVFKKPIENILEHTELPAFLVKLPAWYCSGTVLITWSVYLVAYCFRAAKRPLIFGNLIVILIAVVVLVMYYGNKCRNKQLQILNLKHLRSFFWGRSEGKKRDLVPFCYVLVALVFVTYLMFLTFHIMGDEIFVGISVFGDFAPHLGMIRSFSVSNNFPTQYSHFAGEDIRYHFMFQFLAGNLEFLGMRIDFAFNLPSVFGMVGIYMLLFVLTVRITGSRLCGYLTGVFFTFRSSFTLFRYMAEQKKGNVLNALAENTEYLKYTPKEDWGIWNLNVYCNQRHLAFAVSVLLLALLLFYPYLEMMGKKLLLVPQNKNKPVWRIGQVRTLFFSKEAFGIRDLKFAIGMGILLGAIAFWNGSVLIATLAMLFLMAAVSDYRIDYLITAVIALCGALLQSSFFIEGAVVSPEYFLGFILENKTVWGVIVYAFEVTGIALFAAFVGACLLKGVQRYMLLVFLVPFVLTFVLKLTPDVTVNHKWLVVSMMLINIFVARATTVLFEKKGLVHADGSNFSCRCNDCNRNL